MANNLTDKFNRVTSYLRLSVTTECNLNCFYCATGEKTEKPLLSFDEILRIISAAAKIGVSKIRLTGGEPLLRENLADLICKISKIKNINDVSVTTNGHRLPQLAEKLKAAGLNRLNISLDSLNPETYKKINGGELEKVLDGIAVAKKYFENIRINTVVLKNINDNEAENIINFCRCENLSLRFLELMPNDFQSTKNVDCNQHFLSNETLIANLRKKFKLKRLTKKNKSDTAEWFCIDDDNQKIGFISPVSKPFCSNCNRMRLTAHGEIIPCLHGKERISLREALMANDEEKIIEKFNFAARKKIFAHKLIEGKTFCKMKIIGG